MSGDAALDLLESRHRSASWALPTDSGMREVSLGYGAESKIGDKSGERPKGTKRRQCFRLRIRGLSSHADGHNIRVGTNHQMLPQKAINPPTGNGRGQRKALGAPPSPCARHPSRLCFFDR